VQNTGLVLNLALNYGGRAEIADTFRKLMEKCSKGF
jgi:undecaprenyl pyrophosphate synthase